MDIPKIIVVAGPTASGKSDFAVELALQNNGEIISADSRQVYKGLDIGTGKITREEMKGVPHYGLSLYELDDKVSVARFRDDILPVLEDILHRNKTPIICGGTGQYIDALIFDSVIPKVEPNKKLREELGGKSEAELFKELEEKDSVRAESIDKHNKVRLIRALEIIDALGTVPVQETPTLRYQTDFYLMQASRELLHTRITQRLEKRLQQGMIEEVKNIMQQGYTSETMKKFGLEYTSIGKFLEGILTEEEMEQDLITISMQYAKRQETWNKKYLPFAKIIEVKE
jgi:tRNA dimethylallyltransferase